MNTLQPHSLYSYNDLLAIYEALKERYPIGTHIECLHGWTSASRSTKKTGIIRSYMPSRYAINLESATIWVQGSLFNLCVFEKGRWATILSPVYTNELFPIY